MPIKGKTQFKLTEKINFYQCELTTKQNMKNIKNCRSQFKIPAQ